MPRSALFSRRIPGGMYHMPDPLAPTLGNIYYVDANGTGIGTSSAFGKTPDAAFSTGAAAWDSGVLASGDLVLVASGHTEAISAAAGWDCDTAGVYVKGLGWSDLRPAMTLDTANTTDIDIDAASIVFDNLRFVANFLDIAGAIDVNAAAFTMRNCECRDTSVILNALIWVLGASANTSPQVTVENCEFLNVIGSANTACISLPGTSNRCKINDNVLTGDWGTAAILAAGAVTRISILRNSIRNIDAGDDVSINLAASSTGIVAYNNVGALETDNSTDQITGSTGVVFIQNFSVDIGDRQGVLDPVAT